MMSIIPIALRKVKPKTKYIVTNPIIIMRGAWKSVVI